MVVGAYLSQEGEDSAESAILIWAFPRCIGGVGTVCLVCFHGQENAKEGLRLMEPCLDCVNVALGWTALTGRTQERAR